MEISDEEIEKMWLEKSTYDEANRLRYKRRKEIYELYQNSELNSLSPLWNTENKDIDFNKQKDKLREDLLEDGFTIIENVDIELLLDCMFDGYPDLVREKILYNEEQNETNISDVIDKWLSNTKLIPPTILVLDTIVDQSGILKEDTNKLFVHDGKHRINVAYYFGAKTLPILVINKQLTRIKTILNL
jgi:hypothetical protein